MKVNSSDCIRNSEKRFIGELCRGFDWRTIRKIFKQRYNLNMLKAVGTRRGDIVVVDRQVAYKLDFKAMVPLSIVFDRKGNHLALTPAGEMPADGKSVAPADNVGGDVAAESRQGREEITAYDLLPFDNGEGSAVVDPGFDPEKNISVMADKIASMISEINGE